MREIKFRSWLKFKGKMLYDFDVLYNGRVSETNKRILMQYTGLKDKNGKEIYEGDILKSVAYAINQEVTGVVNYNSELAHYCLDTDNNKRIVFLGLINTEVIGNIYENPELLEG